LSPGHALLSLICRYLEKGNIVGEVRETEAVIEGQVDSHFAFFIQSPDGQHGILEMPTPGDNNAWIVENFPAIVAA
jgi:hypothetical protein